jgi:hypothetical protein
VVGKAEADGNGRDKKGFIWRPFASGSRALLRTLELIGPTHDMVSNMNQRSHLELHPEALRAFNESSEALMAEVRPMQRNRLEAGVFRPDVFSSGHLSEADIIGEIEVGVVDGTGNEVGKLFRQGEQQFGLVGDGFQNLKALVAKIQGTPAFRDSISYGCVLNVAFDWVAKKYRRETTISLCEHVIAECAKQLREMDIWIPVYRLHAEEDLKVGSCLFKTITAAMLDEWEQHFRSTVKENGPQIVEMFRAERKRMQGTLAATFRVYAEPERGYELAQERAEYAIGLLNFFHPAHGTFRTRSYATLLGQENIQTTTALVLENGQIRQRQRGLLDRGASPWFLDKSQIQFLRQGGLDKVGALWDKKEKSEYDTCLLNALQLYSKSSLSTLVTDRLVYILAALESMLLRNTSEPVQKNIAERMAFIVKKTVDERKRIVRIVEEIYKIRSSFLHHGQRIKESEVIEEFMVCAWTSFVVLILDSEKFPTRDSMFDAIDNMKFG